MSFIGLYSEKQHSDGIGHAIRRWTIYLSSVVILVLLITSLLLWEWESTPWADFFDASHLAFYIVSINTSIIFLTQPETTAIGLKFRKFSTLAVSYIVISVT